MKIYNKKNVKNIFFVLPVLLLLLSACTEEMKDPCSGNNNIEINVEGINVETCDGVTQEYPASEAGVMIIHFNEDKSEADTLFDGNLDNNGKLNYVIPNSQCGINNIMFVAENNTFYYEDEIGFMCCDTSYVFKFERNCEETAESEVSCESFNTTIDLEITNQYGGCLIVGAEKTDIRWNSTSIQTGDEITVDLTSVAELSGYLYAKISPQPDENGEVQLNGSNELNISFFVETDEVTPRETTQLILPTKCVDGSGNEQMGEIEINVTTEICEDACGCPFSDNGDVNKAVDYSAYPVSVGTTLDYNNQNIFTIEEGMLDSECYLIITDVIRFNSTSDAAAFSSNHDWRISNRDELLGAQIRLNDRFDMSTEFKPEVSGERTDTFEIIVDVYNRVDEVKESCSFIVEYKGTGCENICPEIIKMNSLSADFVDPANGDVLQDLKWGDRVQMGTGNNIVQQMSGNLGNMCMGVLTGSETVAYMLNVPDDEDIITCSDIEIDYQIEDNGNTGDRDFFSVNDDFTLLSKGADGVFTVSFNTPNAQTHIQNNHDSEYKARLTISASNSSGEVICEQILDLSAEVYQNTISVSESMIMKAFSQVSDKEPESAYQVYKIDIYDDIYNYFGRIDNLNVNHVDFTTNPPSPQSNHSFYFEVEQPQNVNLRQIPKLFLVKNSGKPDFNKFSRVTEKPVANYSSNGDFSADLDNLIDHVFKAGTFTSLGNPPNYSFEFSDGDSYGWEPYRSADEMALDGIGVDINLGDVFVIWNPDGMSESFTSGSTTYSSYCDVAFLYIDGLSDGNSTNHNVGFVSFYVAYPLSVIEN